MIAAPPAWGTPEIYVNLIQVQDLLGYPLACTGDLPIIFFFHLTTGEGRLRDVFAVEALQDALRCDALHQGQDPQDVQAGHHQAVPRQPQLMRFVMTTEVQLYHFFYYSGGQVHPVAVEIGY